MSEPHCGKWSRARLAIVVFAAMATVLLVAEHRWHLLPYLPWLFLLACPILHLFHHRGHGRHDERIPGHSSDSGGKT